MFKRALSQIPVAVLWLLHFLPLPILAILGHGLGAVLFRFARRRRTIALTNLKLCFPELDEAAQRNLARNHFKMVARSILERSILWWGSPQRLNRLIHIEGEEILRAAHQSGKPIILLAPHFVGLDAGGIGIATRYDSLSMYSTQKNPVFDKLLLRGRKRFGDQLLLSRQDGARTSIKAMRSGRPFYYLPDMDLGARDAVFAPFFGIPAATITGLSRLARAAGAVVIPCITRILPDGQGYIVKIGDPWENFPTADAEADTRRMNAFIEAEVRTMPEQYYWVHRRFKTRPEGEARYY
ncbi:MAG: lipid A biosynthesis acyltransferase [Betaproteobacteria bacterium]